MHKLAINEAGYRAESEQAKAEVESPEEKCEIIELPTLAQNRDLLFSGFANEIDAWARQALARNGFGDF